MPGVAAIMVALTLLSSGCGEGATQAGTPTPAPIVGAVAPGFALATLDGQTVRLDELRGQPVFLTFWTTTCGACRRQMPFVQAAFEEKGAEVMFIAVNIQESTSRVQQYVEDEAIVFTIGLDANAAVALAYNIRYIPCNVLIDGQGVIRGIRVGAFHSTLELLAALENLMADAP